MLLLPPPMVTDVYPIHRRLRDVIGWLSGRLQTNNNEAAFIKNFIDIHYAVTNTGESQPMYEAEIKKAFDSIEKNRQKREARSFFDWLSNASKRFMDMTFTGITFMPNPDKLHAELVMFMEFYNTATSKQKHFPYIGVNKFCCCHCTYLFRKYNLFHKVPGASGDLFGKWNFPKDTTIIDKYIELLQGMKREQAMELVKKLGVKKEYERINAQYGTSFHTSEKWDK